MTDYLFARNKYFEWYMSLCLSRQRTRRAKYQGVYYEVHHIVPRSLGGSSDASNLVLLTAREHFVAHRLLPRMLSGVDRMRMNYALYRFAGQHRDIKRSRQYKIERERITEEGRPALSEDHRRKLSEALKGRKQSPEYIEKHRLLMIGQKRTDESKAKMAAAKAKPFRFIDPNGVEFEGSNLKAFCLVHDLNQGKMNRLRKYGSPPHKGWTIAGVQVPS